MGSTLSKVNIPSKKQHGPCLTLERGDEIFLIVEWNDDTSATVTLCCVHHEVDANQWQDFRFPTRHISQHGYQSMEIKLWSGEATVVQLAQGINSLSRMEAPGTAGRQRFVS